MWPDLSFELRGEWGQVVVQENGRPAMLWVFTKPWHVSAATLEMNMTIQIEIRQSEGVRKEPES